jgi:hypothetical protein
MFKYIHLERSKGFVTYYRKIFVESLSVTICLSIILAILQASGLLWASRWYISLMPVALYLLLMTTILIVNLIITINMFKGLLIRRIDASWYINNANGDISSDFFYNIVNASKIPIKEIVPDREGFFTEVIYQPKYSVLGNAIELKLCSLESYEEEIAFHSHNVTTKLFDAHLVLEPPLQPKEVITIQRQYDVIKSEMKAFSKIGTYAGLRIFHPTNIIEMRLYSPPHFRIVLLNYFIGDEEGVVKDTEKRKQLSPLVSEDYHFIYWKILYPKNHYRYWFNYRLEYTK